MAITRLAPSPTGALHLGNARTFLVNWWVARQRGWRILLRIEDLDGPRVKAGADRAAMDDLRWLGIDWDEGPVYQSPRADLYRAAARTLLDAGKAYACVCTRREVELAASAPHAEDGAAVYPGTCRGRFKSLRDAEIAAGRVPVVRFAVPDGPVEFTDGFHGPIRTNPASELGDFVIEKADGTAAYQLAVVVDDAEMGVTEIVRGDDLVDSTPRQILLYRALGMADRIPNYWHLPLVVGTDGKRLAKRHGDTRLAYYRNRGVPAERVVALLARWCGIDAAPRASAHDLIAGFDLNRLPAGPIIFTKADDRWLLEGT
ncbi:MAG TPA: tRNA glutamyl-Q(34) synthetase GluQRS [Tepidisphaeraceae bacterium]|jgi:glutamyl-tRNA synthetase